MPTGLKGNPGGKKLLRRPAEAQGDNREITPGCVICEPRLSLCQRREVATGFLLLGTAVNTSLPAGAVILADLGMYRHLPSP